MSDILFKILNKDSIVILVAVSLKIKLSILKFILVLIIKLNIFKNDSITSFVKISELYNLGNNLLPVQNNF